MGETYIEGSHGSLVVNRTSGEIIATSYGCESGCDECGYVDGGQAYPYILRFDPATLTDEAMDINRVGYFYEGGYEPPVKEPVI